MAHPTEPKAQRQTSDSSQASSWTATTFTSRVHFVPPCHVLAVHAPEVALLHHVDQRHAPLPLQLDVHPSASLVDIACHSRPGAGTSDIFALLAVPGGGRLLCFRLDSEHHSLRTVLRMQFDAVPTVVQVASGATRSAFVLVGLHSGAVKVIEEHANSKLSLDDRVNAPLVKFREVAHVRLPTQGGVHMVFPQLLDGISADHVELSLRDRTRSEMPATASEVKGGQVLGVHERLRVLCLTHEDEVYAVSLASHAHKLVTRKVQLVYKSEWPVTVACSTPTLNSDVPWLVALGTDGGQITVLRLPGVYWDRSHSISVNANAARGPASALLGHATLGANNIASDVAFLDESIGALAWYDPRTLIAASLYGQVACWDVIQPSLASLGPLALGLRDRFAPALSPVRCILVPSSAVQTTRRTFFVGCSTHVLEYGLDRRAVVRGYWGHSDYVDQLDFALHGGILQLGTYETDACDEYTVGGQPPTAHVSGVRVGLLTASADSTVREWDIDTGIVHQAFCTSPARRWNEEYFYRWLFPIVLAVTTLVRFLQYGYICVFAQGVVDTAHGLRSFFSILLLAPSTWSIDLRFSIAFVYALLSLVTFVGARFVWKRRNAHPAYEWAWWACAGMAMLNQGWVAVPVNIALLEVWSCAALDQAIDANPTVDHSASLCTHSTAVYSLPYLGAAHLTLGAVAMLVLLLCNVVTLRLAGVSGQLSQLDVSLGDFNARQLRGEPFFSSSSTGWLLSWKFDRRRFEPRSIFSERSPAVARLHIVLRLCLSVFFVSAVSGGLGVITVQTLIMVIALILTLAILVNPPYYGYWANVLTAMLSLAFVVVTAAVFVATVDHTYVHSVETLVFVVFVLSCSLLGLFVLSFVFCPQLHRQRLHLWLSSVARVAARSSRSMSQAIAYHARQDVSKVGTSLALPLLHSKQRDSWMPHAQSLDFEPSDSACSRHPEVSVSRTISFAGVRSKSSVERKSRDLVAPSMTTTGSPGLVVVVAGAARGIGLETARGCFRWQWNNPRASKQLTVVMVDKQANLLKSACDSLLQDIARRRPVSDAKFHVDSEVVDLVDCAQVNAAVERIARKHGSIDKLLYVAGHLEPEWSERAWRLNKGTNVDGFVHMLMAVMPHMAARRHGRIVVVTSGFGQTISLDAAVKSSVYELSQSAESPHDFLQLQLPQGSMAPLLSNNPFGCYALSKALQLVLVRWVTTQYRQWLRERDILWTIVCPGWCRTPMGGTGAPRSATQGADSVLWAADIPTGGPSGTFVRDRRRLAW